MEAVTRKEYQMENLCCPVCAEKIRCHIAELGGVSHAQLDFATQKLTLDLAATAQADDLLVQAVRIARQHEPDVTIIELDQPATTQDAPATDRGRKELLHRLCMGFGAALFVLGLVLNFAVALPQPAEFTLFLVSYLLVGGEVLWRAARNCARGEIFDENFLMSIATIGAFILGEYPEGVAVMLFYQVGEAFEHLAVGRTRTSIAALMDIRPDFANLKTGDVVTRVAPDSVRVGDLIVVRAGEKIPLDGRVLEGRSALDTSALTGEALPRDVARGDEVLSGSINKSGLLTIEVTKSFGESTVSKILDLVQNASAHKAPVENFITRFARVYTPVVVFSAVALALIPPLLIPDATFAEWVGRALVFLVVSCPCALVISIPLSFFGGIGGASRNGILVKGSNYLEALNNIDTVVFDKTGTLTKGVFKVTQTVAAEGHRPDELLFFAAHAESNSTHPIATSILAAYGKPVEAARIHAYEERAGHGVRVVVDDTTVLAGNKTLMEAEGIAFTQPETLGTVVYLALNGRFAGYLVIADEVKPDSRQAIANLRAAGVRSIVMLTGDSKQVGQSVGAELGIDTVFAELLPHQKVEQLEELERRRTGTGRLAAVGDGINDAPLLARSDVGIAMGGVGSDAAIEAADVVLMTDEPSKIVSAIRIAQRTHRIVWQNIIFALGVKAIILVLGAAGIASLWAAVFGDVGVAVLAILNAMRAMRVVKE